jgi:hypothetical protein
MRMRVRATVALVGLVAGCLSGLASPTPAQAVVGNKALVLNSMVSGGASSVEAAYAAASGYAVDVVDDPTWGAMAAADFAEYELVIIGDPTCNVLSRVVSENAVALADAVMARAGGNTEVGNRMLIGTDPRFHYNGSPTGEGGKRVIETGIDFSGAQPGRTDLFMTFSCFDQDWDGNGFGDGTDKLLPLLTADPAPNWTVNQPSPCTGEANLIANADQFATLTSEHLQNWFCSSHMTFPTYAADWFPLAIAPDAATDATCGTDVTTGEPACGEAHILIAGSGIVVEAPNLALNPPTETLEVGTTGTVVATTTNDDDTPRPGVTVSFVVTGANNGASGTCVPASCVTDDNGNVSFSYTGANAGTDTIAASVTVSGTTQSATATKTWVDRRVATVSINDVSVTEGDTGTTPATFTVSLSEVVDGDVTVFYSTSDGTATAADYNAASGSVTIPGGSTSATVQVDVLGDVIDESDETFNVNLDDVKGRATIGDPVGVGTILDDDVDRTISIDDVTVLEGDAGTTPAIFTVSLDAPAHAPISVDYATADGSATSPADYAPAAGSVSFAVGEQSQTVSVDVNGDTVDEPTEAFAVVLSGATGPATVGDGTGIGTIIDDDRDGGFSCRGSAIRIGTLEPVVANPPDSPCKDEFKSLLNLSPLLSLLGVKAGVANAWTDQTPDDLGGLPAEFDKAVAHGDVVSLGINIGANVITASAVSSDAAAICRDGEARLNGASRIVGLKVNGRQIIVGDGPMTVPLIGGNLYVNRTIKTKTKVTQRALDVTLLGLNVVVAEAIANVEGNPCTAISEPPPGPRAVARV